MSEHKYTEDQHPCLVAKKFCGCYVAAAGLDDSLNLEEITDFYNEVRKWGEGYEIEFRPISFVRSGGLNFSCPHGARPSTNDRKEQV